MQFIRDILDNVKPNFEKGGKWEKYYYLYEAHETLFFQPNHTAPSKGAHVRDAVDLKRMMVTVIVALIPCLLYGMYNVGVQHFTAAGEAFTFGSAFAFGAIKTLPIVAVCYATGLAVEFVFSVVRKHPVNEGFLVSGMLIPLVVPPTMPLWMVAVATIIAVLLGKEVFGGTGMNLLNPALTARAVLFFGYAKNMSGDQVWTALDGYTGATVLGDIASKSKEQVAELVAAGNGLFSVENLFFGNIPGSIGETSALMCLIGAAILVITGVGSWRIMVSMVLGGLAMGYLVQTFNNGGFGAVPAYYQLIMGGFAFGTVFMATDPVSAAQTNVGKWIYGFMAGFLSILIRVINPAYPEGVMLAILLMNVLAPLIDYFVVNANKKRRLSRATV